MATLNETAHISRNAIKYGAIALAVMIVGRFILELGVDAYNVLFPDKPNPPSMGYGILPPLEFPITKASQLEYRLETANGTLPVFPDRMNVYQYTQSRANLLGLEQANDVVKRLGFDTEPEQLTETVYRWETTNKVPGVLEMDVVDGNFSIQYAWYTASDFFEERVLVDELSGMDRTLDFLDSPGLIPNDLRTGPSTITYLKARGRSYEETISLSESDFVQVDFFRAFIDDQYEAVTPEPSKGIVRVVLTNYPRVIWFVGVEYSYFGVNYERAETYPIKTVEQAWQELINGQGYVASVDYDAYSVVVRDVRLAYYDAYDKQAYLQPVYVFRGDDNFIGYVPALVDLQMAQQVQAN